MFKYFKNKKQDLKFWKELKNEVKLLAALQKLQIHKILDQWA